jgi:2-deoxy-D-gluconate 3-dehydrogenase
MSDSPEKTSLPALFDLHGRAAIVTGGAGLLGSEFCKTLVEAGARVVIADLDESAAERLAAELCADRQAGTAALAVRTDVTDPASVQAMVGAALQAFGRLDILVNSAALDPKFDPGHSAGPSLRLLKHIR